MYFNFDLSQWHTNSLFPDYRTQGHKQYDADVILNQLLKLEYTFPLHPFVVICCENYFGANMYIYMYSCYDNMETAYRKYKAQTNNNKFYFYCNRGELIQWLAYNLGDNELANSTKKERVLSMANDKAVEYVTKKEFLAKNFVNSSQSFYHIVEVARLYNSGNLPLWGHILEFADYALENINYIPYINSSVEEARLTDIFNKANSKMAKEINNA